METTIRTMDVTQRDAFEAELARHRGAVFKVANTYARSAEDRADLAQEIAAQLWRAYPRYDRSRPFTTWMYRIALNVAISFARSNEKSRFGESLSDAHDSLVGASDVDVASQEPLERLQRFLASLDPLNRALMLLHLEDRPHREIADVLGITETNVATKLTRLRQAIRAHFETQEKHA